MKYKKSRPKKRIHCVGVKGIGLSALAQMLKAQGHTVTGSDVVESFPADKALRNAGIRVYRGFARKHITASIDLIVASNAYLPPKTANGKWQIANSRHAKGQKSHSPFAIRHSLNAEVAEALKRGIPILSYPEALGALFNNYKGIAVAGSHGKSTTSALLAVALEYLGADPYAVIGAVVKNWNSNARIPKSHSPLAIRHLPFVIEADEYRRAFHNYSPFGAVITSVDWDHPDIYKTRTAYRESFKRFIHNIDKDGFLVINEDDSEAKKLITAKKGLPNMLTYGYRASSALRIRETHHFSEGITVDLVFRKKRIGTFKTPLFGKHHALNVAAAVGVCLMLNYKPEAIRDAIRRFQGTVRRFDIHTKQPYRGKPIIIDDYAHHPAEIRATIQAARAMAQKRKIRVLFQPHTFSRTEAYFDDFVGALSDADDVALLKTFGSAREPSDNSAKAPKSRGRKSAKDLARALNARYFANHQAAYRYYRLTLSSNDVLIVMGAGDGDVLARRIAKRK